MSAVLVGTCGYDYEDWRGVLYGPKMPRGEFLRAYADRFMACELDYTFYRPPTARSLWLAAQNSLRRVTFTLKVPGRVTHERSDVEAVCAGLLRAVEPLREMGLLGALLAQFPYSFRNTPDAWAFLGSLAGLLAGPPLVVEFRNSSFATEESFERLRELGLGFCVVDAPRLKGLMPPVVRATSDVGYVRLHGRNARHWWEHEDRAQRYSYLYSREELAAWVGPIRRLQAECRTTFVFFNNHHMGQAVVNALEMMEMLGEAVEPGAECPHSARDVEPLRGDSRPGGADRVCSDGLEGMERTR